MKAKITYEIGCGVNSVKCAGCIFVCNKEYYTCPYKGKNQFNKKEIKRFKDGFRFKQCLKSEKATSEQVDKSKIEEIIDYAKNLKYQGAYMDGLYDMQERLEKLLKEEG